MIKSSLLPLAIGCLLLIGLGLRSSEAAAVSGAVSGVVVDPEGGTLSGATVVAVVSSPNDTRERTSISGEQGSFLLTELPVGEGTLYAHKEVDNYPEQLFAFFVTSSVRGSGTTVKVEAGRTSSGVVVRVGQKGGRFQVQIADSVTGKPVINARLVFTRIDEPQIFFATGPDGEGAKRLVVPPVPFMLKVVAPDYLDWSSEPIRIAPAAEKTLVVSLKPTGR